jgi:hypothetical protein
MCCPWILAEEEESKNNFLRRNFLSWMAQKLGALFDDLQSI